MKYEQIWRNKWLTDSAKTIDDMIISLRDAADHLAKLKELGVVLDDESDISSDYAMLLVDDKSVADSFGFTDPEEEEDE